MQSEAGAAGALHGATTRGALATTFTASQGLLLMLPNMYKIAGELSPAVIHVAARAIATHALSIFGDHSDVMAARPTGWAMLCAASPQEAADFALVAHVGHARVARSVPALLRRLPHQPRDRPRRHPRRRRDRARSSTTTGSSRIACVALDPDRPVLRGSAQNPDVFFQAREAGNPYMLAVPGIVERAFARSATRPDGATGSSTITARPTPNASSCSWVRAPVRRLRRSTRSSPAARRSDSCKSGSTGRSRSTRSSPRCRRPCTPLPCSTAPRNRARRATRCISTSSPRSRTSDRRDAARRRRPLRTRLQGVHARDGQGRARTRPATASRSGSSTTSPTRAVAARRRLRHRPRARPRHVLRARRRRHRRRQQAHREDRRHPHAARTCRRYFVYDSKKSGSTTVSHVRFDDAPIRSTYLIRHANFVACHQFGLLDRLDVLAAAEPGATFLLNSPVSGRRDVGPAPARSAGADHRARPRRARDRRAPRRARRRARGPDQHRHASVLLRAHRRDAARRRARRHARVGRRRPTAGGARRSSTRTSPRSTPRSPRCTASLFPPP